MPIRTALLPVAGRGLKPYPAWDTVDKLLHPIIDRDGVAKPVLQVLAEDCLSAGIERLVLIVSTGESESYQRQIALLARTLTDAPASSAAQKAQGAWLNDLLPKLVCVEQDQPRGLGHAIWCAREAIQGDRFLVLLGDHLLLSADPTVSCTAQLLKRCDALPGTISAVEPLPERKLHRYGVVAGVPVPGERGLWTVERVVEKPSPTRAEQDLETPGLRRGEYLGFFGMHVLPRTIIDRLAAGLGADLSGPGDLSPVLDELARAGGYHAVRLEGSRQDIGKTYGLVEAQLERGLLGPDRDDLLHRLNELLLRDGLRHGRSA